MWKCTQLMVTCSVPSQLLKQIGMKQATAFFASLLCEVLYFRPLELLEVLLPRAFVSAYQCVPNFLENSVTSIVTKYSRVD